ncbi:MAG: hypothetical protein ACREPL_07515 [Rhodanobacteraceae bacterium]
MSATKDFVIPGRPAASSQAEPGIQLPIFQVLQGLDSGFRP